MVCASKGVSAGKEEASAGTADRAISSESLADLVRELGRRDILGPNPAFDAIRGKGRAAVPELLRVLHSDNVTLVANAIQLLADVGVAESLPDLRRLESSRWPEVARAASTAIALLQRGAGGVLMLDTKDAFEQIGRLWTATIQEERDVYPADVLRQFCMQAIKAMPRLQFDSDPKRGAAWMMLGDLLYKSVHPE
jgi:hypothetical protein